MGPAARPACTVRPLEPDDRPALLDLWVASWQAAYPAIDFTARRGWAAQRFDELQQQGHRILVAFVDDAVVGAVTVAPGSGYIDQIVVGTNMQRRGVAARLIAAARDVSPARLELHVNQDNAPAVAFYRSEGFAVTAHETNEQSGAPTFRMSWHPSAG